MSLMQETAKQLDEADPVRLMRELFVIPQMDGQEEVYFVGNSLGLMPKRTEVYIQAVLEKWKTYGVRGHFLGKDAWGSYAESLSEPMGNLVGGLPHEIVIMNTLTVNLHLMMATFYRPTSDRFKVLIEDHAFPSDQYAVESQIRWHGFTPESALLTVRPDPGEWLLTTDRICQMIEQNKDSLALVLLPGVQYYTGQVLEMARITEMAHRFDIPVGFDLAHAAGNVSTQLHDWGVDFAAWCTYKYLNSGPGSLAGCFVHERHVTNTDLPRLAGWWGHDKSTRFAMESEFVPIQTAEGWQLSNPPILSMAAVKASLDVFTEAGGIEVLRAKSKQMSRYFRERLTNSVGNRVRIITPEEQSGCQLSLQVHEEYSEAKKIFERLGAEGVRTDWREPNVIRAAPTPLYNRFTEIDHFVKVLENCLEGSSG